LSAFTIAAIEKIILASLKASFRYTFWQHRTQEKCHDVVKGNAGAHCSVVTFTVANNQDLLTSWPFLEARMNMNMYCWLWRTYTRF